MFEDAFSLDAALMNYITNIAEVQNTKGIKNRTEGKMYKKKTNKKTTMDKLGLLFLTCTRYFSPCHGISLLEIQ